LLLASWPRQRLKQIFGFGCQAFTTQEWLVPKRPLQGVHCALTKERTISIKVPVQGGCKFDHCRY
jgi:hypothetical protein